MRIQSPRSLLHTSMDDLHTSMDESQSTYRTVAAAAAAESEQTMLQRSVSAFGAMRLVWMMMLVVTLVTVGTTTTTSGRFVPPFTQVLGKGDVGNEVVILQHLVMRSPYVEKGSVDADGTYGEKTEEAVGKFQEGNGLLGKGGLGGGVEKGVAGEETTRLLLEKHLDDGYVDSGVVPEGYLYKVYVPVFRNRSVEVSASLYDKENRLVLSFPVKTHGQDVPGTDTALNMLATDGSTPTGLMTFDLNSPEDDVKDFGPYPVNRAVAGVEGNAGFLLPHIRNGILLHTYEPAGPIPYSLGCIQSHPRFIKEVWEILVGMGVEVRNNTFGKLPYPYKPQGVLSVAIVD